MKKIAILLLFNAGCTEQCVEEAAERRRYEATCTEFIRQEEDYFGVVWNMNGVAPGIVRGDVCYRCEDGKELCR